MSETITDIGGLRVVLRDDGGASIWDGDPTEGSSAIAITADERMAVALALLGDWDALIERCAKAIWKPGLWETEVEEVDKELSRQDTRAVLREAFGLTEPTE